MRSSLHPRGFTLIELLVVISIIALLIAILLPALGAARNSARTMTCLTNVRSMGQGIYIYATENDASLPPALTTRGSYGAPGSNYSTWESLIRSYVAGTSAQLSTLTDEDYERVVGAFRCPNATFPELGNRHYSAMPRLMPHLNTAALVAGVRPYRTDDVIRAADVVMVLDGAQDPTDPAPFPQDRPYAARANALYVNSATFGGAGLDYDETRLDEAVVTGPNGDGATIAEGRQNIRWRDGNNKAPGVQTGIAANFLFVDGHASTVSAGDLYNRNIWPDPR